ncbi:YraN family protein [Teredinibacter sp. KSP-S5-2]|uniref:YraN family protein n=1 Tax=Teredinibacter sp. KSP-S5-2 TaxID=3034506 RepID=UPI002934D967|nr:YraN family protein [Teredinibacter sp. KSP-S5-2]WNO08525.1 YraN family protein [Teredinibacter sp. KSP-S5-2]
MFSSRRKKAQSIGEQAESLAEKYLQQHGLKTVDKNYRCKLGEIDLIMQDKQTLVFVEVRYRNSDAFGSPVESVTYRKQEKIRKTAQLFLQKHTHFYNTDCRFDILGISPGNTEWIKAAF